ncbi:hypothetical protein [Acinetobacter chengduensis]|uniref:Uncharacterized protein n=1 Tax=Acinetobacter chengduensis TaxID=2420890 RepID=A0ABX9TSP3_9GAMM|nr:hypothetical protein [Acinetobacter chengduensis]RLL19038.1 hypothetical protein D9K81_14895 [Acinetobacter chengduensis]
MNTQQKNTKKVAPNFGERQQRARTLITGKGEDFNATPVITPQAQAAFERKRKNFKNFMEFHKIHDVDDLELKRLNCEIPKELHTWLNVYSRSNVSDYGSMTEIVIDLLNKFAHEQGFSMKLDKD